MLPVPKRVAQSSGSHAGTPITPASCSQEWVRWPMTHAGWFRMPWGWAAKSAGGTSATCSRRK